MNASDPALILAIVDREDLPILQLHGGGVTQIPVREVVPKDELLPRFPRVAIIVTETSPNPKWLPAIPVDA